MCKLLTVKWYSEFLQGTAIRDSIQERLLGQHPRDTDHNESDSGDKEEYYYDEDEYFCDDDDDVDDDDERYFEEVDDKQKRGS